MPGAIRYTKAKGNAFGSIGIVGNGLCAALQGNNAVAVVIGNVACIFGTVDGNGVSDALIPHLPVPTILNGREFKIKRKCGGIICHIGSTLGNVQCKFMMALRAIG